MASSLIRQFWSTVRALKNCEDWFTFLFQSKSPVQKRIHHQHRNTRKLSIINKCYFFLYQKNDVDVVVEVVVEVVVDVVVEISCRFLCFLVTSVSKSIFCFSWFNCGSNTHDRRKRNTYDQRTTNTLSPSLPLSVSPSQTLSVPLSPSMPLKLSVRSMRGPIWSNL